MRVKDEIVEVMEGSYSDMERKALELSEQLQLEQQQKEGVIGEKQQLAGELESLKEQAKA